MLPWVNITRKWSFYFWYSAVNVIALGEKKTHRTLKLIFSFFFIFKSQITFAAHSSVVRIDMFLYFPKVLIQVCMYHWHYNQLTIINSSRYPNSNMIKTYKCASEPNLRNTMSNLRNLTISCNYNIAVNIEKKRVKRKERHKWLKRRGKVTYIQMPGGLMQKWSETLSVCSRKSKPNKNSKKVTRTAEPRQLSLESCLRCFWEIDCNLFKLVVVKGRP